MEEEKRDIFAEALELLRERHFAKYGYTAEVHAVRIVKDDQKDT